jgi:hypothetical protein
MQHGKTQIKEREIGGPPFEAARVEPAAAEPEHPAVAPHPVTANIHEFQWSLATYFGQSFVVGAYRARE